MLGSYDECEGITINIAQGTLAGVNKPAPIYPRTVGTRFCRVKFNLPDSITKGIVSM